MTLTEIKTKATKAALINTLTESCNAMEELTKKLGAMDEYNRNRNLPGFVKEFRQLQQLTDEAFCELFDPKPTSL